jgi:sugar fermentation stimulation protein A
MEFKSELIPARFLRRYKRFFADVEIAGKTVVAHVPNSGSMKGCQASGANCLVTHNPDPKRKLHYTLEMVETPTSWVGVNTSHPNRLVMELWESKKYKFWKTFDRAQAEVKISEKSRIDFVFWSDQNEHLETLKSINFKTSPMKFHFVEVKNVSLAQTNTALFPDSVTERGQKHLLELMELKEYGHSCEILFVIQRTDCKLFSPADHIDPEYGMLLRKAVAQEVKATALICEFTSRGVFLLPDEIEIRL